MLNGQLIIEDCSNEQYNINLMPTKLAHHSFGIACERRYDTAISHLHGWNCSKRHFEKRVAFNAIKKTVEILELSHTLAHETGLEQRGFLKCRVGAASPENFYPLQTKSGMGAS